MKIKEWRRLVSPLSAVWAVFAVGSAIVLIRGFKHLFSEAFLGVLYGLALAVMMVGSYWTIPYLVRVIRKCQLWIFGDEPIDLALLLRFFGAVLLLPLLGAILGAIVLVKKIDIFMNKRN